MYKLENLSKDKITELNSILEKTNIGNQVYLDYLKSITQGLVDYHHRGKGDMKINHFSPRNNQNLVKFLFENFSIRKDDIISIHINDYNEGSYAEMHQDSNSSKTYLILLEPAIEGGDLMLEDAIIPFNKIGQVVSYNSGKIMHGVSKIIKGHRRTLVVWVNERSVI
jgi:Rps23 Pro-64 3,4-dihydroxylase Tpa1-like proline 4-hydroxylase